MKQGRGHPRGERSAGFRPVSPGRRAEGVRGVVRPGGAASLRPALHRCARAQEAAETVGGGIEATLALRRRP